MNKGLEKDSALKLLKGLIERLEDPKFRLTSWEVRTPMTEGSPQFGAKRWIYTGQYGVTIEGIDLDAIPEYD